MTIHNERRLCPNASKIRPRQRFSVHSPLNCSLYLLLSKLCSCEGHHIAHVRLLLVLFALLPTGGAGSIQLWSIDQKEAPEHER